MVLSWGWLWPPGDTLICLDTFLVVPTTEVPPVSSGRRQAILPSPFPHTGRPHSRKWSQGQLCNNWEAVMAEKKLLSNQFTLALGQRSACWQHGRESNSSELLSSCSEKQLYCLCVKTLNSQLLGSTWFGGWGVQLSSPWGPKVKSLELKTWGSSHIVPCCLHFSRPLPRFPPWILLAIDSSLLSLSLVWALQGLKQRKWGWLNSGPEKA